MFTRAQRVEAPSPDSAANRAASAIDEGVHKGADALADAAHQTVEHLGKASSFLQQRSQFLKNRASGVAEFARQHPVYVVMALGALGAGLGYAMRRRRG